MTRISSRPATADDLRIFYPEMPTTVRAWVCEMDGEVAGILGLALSRPAHSIFSTFTEGLRPHLKGMTVMRMVKQMQAAMLSVKGPVLAVRDRSEAESVHLLKKLGFRFHALVDGDAIYRLEVR